MNGMQTALAAALASAAGVFSFVAGPDSTTSSSCETVLGSEVCTWVIMDGGHATELGATIPMELIEAVSTDVEMVWPPRPLANVPFPREAREALGIDHLGLNWEAHGHPPASFATPHFDFHFYSLPEADVRSIDCADESKPAKLPAPYALPDIDVPGMGRFVGLCVPGMGMHAMPADEVDETDPFAASVLIGYYGGAPIFLEPMVSRELLRRKADFTLPVPEIAGLPRGGHHPRTFRAEYDAEGERYHLVFAGFEAR